MPARRVLDHGAREYVDRVVDAFGVTRAPPPPPPPPYAASGGGDASAKHAANIVGVSGYLLLAVAALFVCVHCCRFGTCRDESATEEGLLRAAAARRAARRRRRRLARGGPPEPYAGADDPRAASAELAARGGRQQQQQQQRQPRSLLARWRREAAESQATRASRARGGDGRSGRPRRGQSAGAGALHGGGGDGGDGGSTTDDEEYDRAVLAAARGPTGDEPRPATRGIIASLPRCYVGDDKWRARMGMVPAAAAAAAAAGAGSGPGKGFDFITSVALAEAYDAERDTCSICCEETEPGDEIVVLTCAHAFHDECMTPWLRVKLECPVCRHLVERVSRKDARAVFSPPPTSRAGEGGGREGDAAHVAVDVEDEERARE